jgi:hypothetical protein
VIGSICELGQERAAAEAAFSIYSRAVLNPSAKQADFSFFRVAVNLRLNNLL